MDPDLLLYQLRAAARDIRSGAVDGTELEGRASDLAHLFEVLDQHLEGGGARPIAWNDLDPLLFDGQRKDAKPAVSDGVTFEVVKIRSDARTLAAYSVTYAGKLVGYVRKGMVTRADRWACRPANIDSWAGPFFSRSEAADYLIGA